MLSLKYDTFPSWYTTVANQNAGIGITQPITVSADDTPSEKVNKYQCSLINIYQKSVIQKIVVMGKIGYADILCLTDSLQQVS